MKSIDMMFKNSVSLNKQTNKQTNKRILCREEVQLFTRTSLFRMWGEWCYLVSSLGDVYA